MRSIGKELQEMLLEIRQEMSKAALPTHLHLKKPTNDKYLSSKIPNNKTQININYNSLKGQFHEFFFYFDFPFLIIIEQGIF